MTQNISTMALINCSECGKEVSDKAASCPNCGNPIQESTQSKEKEYLCCPKCHSRDLHSEHKGFSGGKALAGAVLTGGIGLLAGAIGSKDVQITCLKCGNKFKAGEAKSSRDLSRPNDIDKELLDMIKAGNMLNAVQFFKARSGYDLVSSKRYVDDLAARHNINPSTNSGCAGVILLGVLFTGLLYYFI